MIVEIEPAPQHEEEIIAYDEAKLMSLDTDQAISYLSLLPTNAAFAASPLVQPSVAEFQKIQRLVKSVGLLSSLREAWYSAQSDGFMCLSRFQFCQTLNNAIVGDCNALDFDKDASDRLLAEVCLSLALDWGLFDLIHILATSMDSEDHIAVLPLLRSLVTLFENEPRSQNPRFSPPENSLNEIIASSNGVITSKHMLFSHLKYYLHYLYAVSPAEGSILQEAHSILRALEKITSGDMGSDAPDPEVAEPIFMRVQTEHECVLCKYNVSGHIHPGRDLTSRDIEPKLSVSLRSKASFFDIDTNPKSPVYREIEQFLDQVESEYDAFDRISALITAVETDKPAMFTSSDVYDAIGAAHDMPPSSRSRAALDQRKQTLEVLNEIVTDTSSLITYDQLFALHRTLIPASSGQAGVLRTSTAVGYASPRIYRVFLPAGEVADALRRLVDTINDAARWQQRPLLCAYYAFAVLVFYIHPFHDGNGRCARLLGNLMARKLGFPSVLRASDKTIQTNEFLQRAVVTMEMLRTNRRQTRQARVLSSRKETASMWF